MLFFSGFRPCYIIGVLLLFFSIGSLYAADIKSDAEAEQEQLIQTIIQDLERYKRKLKNIEKKAQEARKKSGTDFNDHKESIQSILNEINDQKNVISNIEKSIAAFKNKHQSYDKMMSEIKKMVDSLEDGVQEIRIRTSSLNKQKALIEANSIRLYEVLVDVRSRYERLFTELNKVKAQQASLEKSNESSVESGTAKIDILSLQHLLSAILVFFIPLAFSFRQKNNMLLADGVPEYQVPILIMAGLFLGYCLLGYGFMDSDTALGIIGKHNPFFMAINSLDIAILPPQLVENLLYKVGFTLLSAMIVFRIVGQKLSSIGHVALAFFIGAVLVPVFGHWVWHEQGWLATMGFMDEMGAVVANMMPVWFACAVLYRRRFIEVEPQQVDQTSTEMKAVYPASQVLLLGLAWIGFVLGTASGGELIFSALANVMLAGIAGSLSGFFHHAFFHTDASRVTRASGGFLSGLVAIAACAQTVTFPEALVIGAAAGVLHNIVTNRLRATILPEAWQATPAHLVAIHGICGIWGALAFALFGSAGGFGAPNIGQLMNQGLGIIVALGYGVLLGLLVGKWPFSSRKRPQTT